MPQDTAYFDDSAQLNVTRKQNEPLFAHERQHLRFSILDNFIQRFSTTTLHKALFHFEQYI
jgi:hypothetical protein